MRRLRGFARHSIRQRNIQISREVKSALDNSLPVVALESTIISHGMPYPQNLEVAKLVEAAVREEGAIPATIAVIGGIPKAGLDDMDLEILANSHGNGKDAVWKASRRDLPYVCAMRYNAATTVASTMILAHLAGIRVFATGGIGGVHYGAEDSMDISADLLELGKTPVAVVCAGIKSILDLSRTMEVLETQGVPIVSMSIFFWNVSGVTIVDIVCVDWLPVSQE